MTRYIYLIILFSITWSCKKSGNSCWEAVEAGTLAPVVFNPPLCDISKKTAEQRYPNYWFYRAGTATNCYKVVSSTNTTYMTNMAEEVMQKMVQAYPFYQVTKVDCGSFCNVVWLEKHKGKITGQYGPLREIHETLFNPDSCSRLTVGRVIIITETPDSLITREVKEKKP
jgi:hypothetical protein